MNVSIVYKRPDNAWSEELGYIHNIIPPEPFRTQATFQVPILHTTNTSFSKGIFSWGIPIVNGPQHTSDNPVND